MTSWRKNRAARDARIAAGASFARGKVVEARDTIQLLEAVIRPGDRVCLEGDNQKQADLLSSALLAVDLSKVNDLHMVQSGVVLPEHLDLFDRGIAKKLDYAYSGPQSARIARMLFGGKIFATCADAVNIWKAEGIAHPESIPELPADRFITLANTIGRTSRDAR